jgi:hypothetical protein
MQNIYTITGVLIAAGLAYLLYRHVITTRQKRAAVGERIFSEVQGDFTNPESSAGEAAGTWKLVGQYQGETFQLQTVVDTLAVRKLPSLWLMVTLPQAQPITSTLDLVMRPTGPTTFSKFDFLDHTYRIPSDFPEQAVLRGDSETVPFSLHILQPHLALFHQRHGKEFLVSPKGLRIVIQIAEADRARYGVFREADFGETVIEPTLLREVMNTLLAFRNDLAKAHSND